MDSKTSPRQPSPQRLAANRRNASKSTGPRTAAGKRRAALNGLRQELLSEELARDLKHRGEDPREFRRLHLDLIALFQPHDAPSHQTLELMAWTWWRKARRARGWTASSPVQADDLDALLEELLLRMVNLLRSRHEWWNHRLAAVLGWPVGGPASVRRQIESRLFIFGAQPGRRKYPTESKTAYLLGRFREEARRIENEGIEEPLDRPGEMAGPLETLGEGAPGLQNQTQPNPNQEVPVNEQNRPRDRKANPIGLSGFLSTWWKEKMARF
jgi:hypothetical protein